MSEASLRQNPINTTDWWVTFSWSSINNSELLAKPNFFLSSVRALDYQERRYGIQSSSLRSAWAHLSVIFSRLVVITYFISITLMILNFQLQRSIYNGPPLLRFHGRTLITRRPSFKLREKVTLQNLKWRVFAIMGPWTSFTLFCQQIWYNISVVSHTLDNFIAVSENEMNDSPSSLYYYDMVDITRQFLQVLVAKVYKQMLGYFYTANFDKFE